MSKKSFEQLQYENAKIENDVNTGCAIVTLVCLGVVVIFSLGLVFLAIGL